MLLPSLPYPKEPFKERFQFQKSMHYNPLAYLHTEKRYFCKK